MLAIDNIYLYSSQQDKTQKVPTMQRIMPVLAKTQNNIKIQDYKESYLRQSLGIAFNQQGSEEGVKKKEKVSEEEAKMVIEDRDPRRWTKEQDIIYI